MIRIVTDSGAELTKEEAKEIGVDLVSLSVTFGEDTFALLTKEDIEKYNTLIEGCKELPSTSQPSPCYYEKVFNDAKEKNDEVIVIALSSGLSGTYQSACIAKDLVDYDKITVIDTLNASIGQRLILDMALELRDQGASRDEIIAKIEECKDKSLVFGMADTLENLKKGGRIPPVLATIGTALKLKPVLVLKDGVIESHSKARGAKQGIESLCQIILSNNPDLKYPVYLGYYKEKKNMELYAEKLKAALPEAKLKEVPIGPVIATHLGGNCVIVSCMKQ